MQWVIGHTTPTHNHGCGQQWSWMASSIMNISFGMSTTCYVFLTTRGNWWRGFRMIPSLRTTIYNILTYILGPHLIRWSWRVASIVGPSCQKNIWKWRSQTFKRTLPGVGRYFLQNASCRSQAISHLGLIIFRSQWWMAFNDTRKSLAS